MSRDVHSCTYWLRPHNTPSPRFWTRYTRALLVSKDRRHLLETPWCGGRTHSLSGEGNGGSIFWKTPDTALYSIRMYVLCGYCAARWIRLKMISSCLLKAGSWRFSADFSRPPSCESPLKIPRHLVQLLAIIILIANAAMKFKKFTAPFSTFVHCALAYSCTYLKKGRRQSCVRNWELGS
jgi:hypothetical protein